MTDIPLFICGIPDSSKTQALNTLLCKLKRMDSHPNLNK